MSFRVEPGSLKCPSRLPQPLAIFRPGHGRPGVGVVVSDPILPKTYFFPQHVIEQMNAGKGGREGYVYREGFDARRVLDSIAPIIQADLPRWRPYLPLPDNISLGNLLISQPGVDLWRMLCIALDHGLMDEDGSRTEQFIRRAPPSLLINNHSLGTVLLAGNHRALTLQVSGLDGLPSQCISVSNMAFNFLGSLRNSVSHVEATFGSSGIHALVQSFINQLAALEAG